MRLGYCELFFWIFLGGLAGELLARWLGLR